MAISACVPKQRYVNLSDNRFFSQIDAEAVVEKTGIIERRVASQDMCASDLACAAAEKIFNETSIGRDTIDTLILVTQTPDYRMPASAILLQHRLGLSRSCAAFDVNLGCSGFVYGLNLAFSMVNQPHIRRIMLINAETRTKVYSFKDKKTGFLFGDAASACVIEKNVACRDSWFKLDSDGEKADYIMIKYGGYRFPSNMASFIEREQEDGSFRSDEQAYMNGYGVFEFVISEVPRHIRGVLDISSVTKDEIDYFVFHQANKFMNDHLVKKLKLNPIKVPYNLDRFGNTSSVSIPLVMVTELKDCFKSEKNIVISGFGVGLSLGSAVLNINDPYICELEEL